MYYVYTLLLSNNEYYVGFSENLRARIQQHMSGEERTTKRFLPCRLVSYTAFKDKYKALAFESYLKSGSGHTFRNRHLI